MRAKVLCPYCGTEKEYFNVETLERKEVVTCDAENGGCDRDFVLETTIKPIMNTKKIEGE